EQGNGFWRSAAVTGLVISLRLWWLCSIITGAVVAIMQSGWPRRFLTSSGWQIVCDDTGRISFAVTQWLINRLASCCETNPDFLSLSNLRVACNCTKRNWP
ncbi:TPA: hypothetical protein ACTYNT_004786, partial [Enterobacter kobei]